MNLLQMSFSGALFIVAVVIIRAVAINKLPKKTFLVLWGIILFRLLVPFSIPSVFSVYTFISVFSNVETGNIIPVLIQGQFETRQLNFSESDIQSVSIWLIIWCIGMVLCVVLFTFFYLRCWIEFQTSHSVHNDYVEQWLKEHPLKRPLSIRQSDKISTPLTYGFFRPVILMPSKTDWKNTGQLQYILLHEYMHICRFDTVIKLVIIIALCVHWFNPMVWVMYILFNRDIELSCDESVIRKFGEASKSVYALMLIDMEAKKSGLTPLCNNFSKNAIEERITAIMRTKKATIVTIILAFTIILGAVGIFATSAIASTNEELPNDPTEHELSSQTIPKSTQISELISVNEIDSSVFDVEVNESEEGLDSFAFFDVKSGQYALSEVIYEVNEDNTLFHYSVNWNPMGNYIQVGLISVDKCDVYSVSCISGRDSRNIDITQIPAGSYYVMVYNETSSDLDLNGAIAYSFD